MAKLTMAQLGRDAAKAVESVIGSKIYTHYVNKTKKYVSIKIDSDHLTVDQLNAVRDELQQLHPTLFKAVYNNTAEPSRRDWIDGEYKSHSWKEEKVNVRFHQLG